MRTLMAVGRVAQGEMRLARRCSYGGGHFFAVEDETAFSAGALMTHGCCPEHEPEMLRQFGEEPAA